MGVQVKSSGLCRAFLHLRLTSAELHVKAALVVMTADEAEHLCSQLLRKNPAKRLGAGERDANEVKGEEFFQVNLCFLCLL